jgi:4-amino-4-deoxychorismate lyase
MSLLFESIRVAQGKFENVVYHEQRMRHSLKVLFGWEEPLDLETYLSTMPIPDDGLYKCRLVYDDQTRSLEWAAYSPKRVERLKVVEHNRINYEFKYSDRKLLNHLYSLRGDCDDILIVKRGLVTDCSYANVAFRKEDEWFTPYQPLLKGTMRQQLLEYNKISEEEIHVKDIKNFDAIKIFNAILRFDSEEISIENITF